MVWRGLALVWGGARLVRGVQAGFEGALGEPGWFGGIRRVLGGGPGWFWREIRLLLVGGRGWFGGGGNQAAFGGVQAGFRGGSGRFRGGGSRLVSGRTRRVLGGCPVQFGGVPHRVGGVGRCVSPGGLLPAELPHPPRVVRLPPLENSHVVVSAVSVRLHVELPEPQLDHLRGTQTPLKSAPTRPHP